MAITNNAINANSSSPLTTTNGGIGVSNPTAHGILVAEGASAVTPIVLAAGQVLIGTTSSDPSAATLTAGTGITITSVSGSITVASSSVVFNWVDQTSTPVTILTNHGYTADNGSTQTVFTLPTSASIGDAIEVQGKGSGGWIINQAASQQIFFGNTSTTAGVSGSLASTQQYDAVMLRALTSGATSIWSVVRSQGNLTVTQDLSMAIVNNSINANSTTPLVRTAGGTQQTSGDFNSVIEQVFTSNGTYTASAGLLYCIVECVGGGGGGGGGSGNANASSAGAGGGSGGYCRKAFSSSAVGSSQTISIGSAGTGGANTGGNGTAGGNTTFGALLTANGGAGGAGMAASTGFATSSGGAGGSASGGSINISGTIGDGGWAQFVAGGLLGTNIVSAMGGDGGSSHYGFGGRGNSGATGGAAGLYGSGGGGSGQAGNATGQAGGAGSAGLVVVTEYIR